MNVRIRHHRTLAAPAAICVLLFLSPAAKSWATPGDVLFSDNLNGNLNSWTIVSSGGDASLGNETASQGQSLRLRWGTVSVTSDPFDAARPAASFQLWIRRGDDSFSEDPDANEDLLVEYFTNAGFWSLLQQFAGNGTPGEILQPTYILPADALHTNLQLRLSTTGSDGPDWDYWHVDQISVTEIAPPTSGGPGTCETFEAGLGNWTITSSGGDAGISSATSNSPSNSLFTRGGAVSVAWDPIDLSTATQVDLDAWIRRGSDSFSEDPDNNEDLLIEYLNDTGSWIVLETFNGQGQPGQTFNRTYALPTDALHSGFQLRVRQTGGNSGLDYWHVDDVCVVASTPILYSLEEDAWTGAAGEVVESGGSGLSGTVFGGAGNDDTLAALPTNPGTCRYADFDGIDDYIEIPDTVEFDLSSELTVAAWINMRSLPSGLHTIVSKDWNYEFHINNSGQVFWWWNDSGGTVRSLTTAAAISLNQWHHVAITYTSGSQRIYVDGAVWATSSFTGSLRLNDLPLFIGTDWNFISRAFDGFIDEVAIHSRALSQGDVQTLRNATHDCATVAAQFTINHDTFGIHCVAETISVDVVDSVAGTPLINYNATVQLDTQSGNGSWVLISGSGSFNDASLDDGVATYDWPLGESQAVFALSYTQGTPVIDVDVFQVSDTGIRDTDAEGNLLFSASGFTLTALPLSNPPPGLIVPFDATQTAAVPFDIHLAAYGQTANDPVCGVIESYSGAKNLKFWSQYLNPVSGSIAVDINGVAVPALEVAAVDQPVVFVNGQAMVTARYKDVGSKQVLVKDDTTINAELPGGIRGGTAGFVLRPDTFVLSDIRNAAGTIINPQAMTSTDPIFIAAGTAFRATVEALDADGDLTPNYGQEIVAETVRLNVQLYEPLGGASPPVSAATGFAAFSVGIATGLDFVWPEVGIIQLSPSIGDADYLGAGDVVGNLSERVGRFVPSHFVVAPNTPMFQTACVAGGFSYTGENFNYLVVPTVTATAQSAGGTTTLNYSANFFKLATATLANRNYTANGALDLSGVPLDSVDPAVSEIGPGIAELLFSGGSGLSFAKAAPTVPFDADIELAIDVIDADGVAAASNPVIFGAGSGILFSGGPEIRFGRLRFLNAVGSERVDLPVPLTAEYFAGTGIGFVTNNADSCATSVTLSLFGFTENLSSGETCALDSGAPGASGVGCAAAAPPAQQFDEPPVGGGFNLSLAAPGVGNTGSVSVAASVPAWLRFDWNAALPGEENPAGQATFGLFDGDAQQIYLREVY